MDANTYYLNKYIEEQEELDEEYERLLEELRDAEPEEFEEIIDSYGYGDVDLALILKDL